VYCTCTQLPHFEQVFKKVGFTHAHVIQMSRLDMKYAQVSNSYVLVGSHRGVVDSIGGPAPKDHARSWSVPDYDGAVDSRIELLLDTKALKVKRRRCVEEYRYLVRRYCTLGRSVLFLHTGHGLGMVGAMMEGCHVVGADTGHPADACTWRLNIFKQVEDTLAEHRNQQIGAPNDAEPSTPMAALGESAVQQTLEKLHADNPMMAEDSEVDKLCNLLVQDACMMFASMISDQVQLQVKVRQVVADTLRDHSTVRRLLADKFTRLMWLGTHAKKFQQNDDQS